MADRIKFRDFFPPSPTLLSCHVVVPVVRLIAIFEQAIISVVQTLPLITSVSRPDVVYGVRKELSCRSRLGHVQVCVVKLSVLKAEAVDAVFPCGSCLTLQLMRTQMFR